MRQKKSGSLVRETRIVRRDTSDRFSESLQDRFGIEPRLLFYRAEKTLPLDFTIGLRVEDFAATVPLTHGSAEVVGEKMKGYYVTVFFLQAVCLERRISVLRRVHQIPAYQQYRSGVAELHIAVHLRRIGA